MGRKKIAVRAVSLMLSILLILCEFVPLYVADALSSKTVRRFNVMLVIDGSESLIAEKTGTDVAGKRYDALDLFLGLLTDSGNEVGAIVFSHEFLLKESPHLLNGLQDKRELSRKIRGATPSGDTDIGGVLLEAVNQLSAKQKENGMESVIILFTDGKIDFSDSAPENEEELEKKSYDNIEKAIDIAQKAENPIPVYTICLNATGTADANLLREISLRTSGVSREITSAQELSQTFEAFYEMIFAGAQDDRRTLRFDENGMQNVPFFIPTYGAEEVNLIFKTNEVQGFTLESPSGLIPDSEIHERIMQGGEYDVIKLVNPQNGYWNLLLWGESESEVLVNLIYNVNCTADLKTQDGQTEYGYNETVKLVAQLYSDGELMTDNSVKEDYKAYLFIKSADTSEPESYQMSPSPEGSFFYELQREEGGFEAWAELRAEGLVLKTEPIQLSFANSIPTILGDNIVEKAVWVTPFSGRHQEYDLAQYFTDRETDTLRYEEVSSQLTPGTAELDGSTLRINTAQSHSGDYVIRAYDEANAYCEMTFRMKVTDLSIPMLVIFALAVLFIGGLLFYFLVYRRIPIFKGTIAVNNVNDTKMPRTHGSFRGKLKLSYFSVYCPGIDPKKCYFRAESGNQITFCSPKKSNIYTAQGTTATQVQILGTTRIYADKNKTNGIKVSVQHRA